MEKTKKCLKMKNKSTTPQKFQKKLVKHISTSTLASSTVHYILQYFKEKFPKSSDYCINHCKTEEEIIIVAKNQHWLQWLYINLIDAIRSFEISNMNSNVKNDYNIGRISGSSNAPLQSTNVTPLVSKNKPYSNYVMLTNGNQGGVSKPSVVQIKSKNQQTVPISSLNNFPQPIYYHHYPTSSFQQQSQPMTNFQQNYQAAIHGFQQQIPQYHQTMPSFQQSNQPMSSLQQQPQQNMSQFTNYRLTIPHNQQIQRFPQQIPQSQPMYFHQVGRQAVKLNPGNCSVSLKGNNIIHTLTNKAIKRSRNEENELVQQQLENKKKQALVTSLNDNKDENCPICLESFEGNGPVKGTGVCRHVFHAKCLDKLLEHDNKCAVCRVIIVKKFGPCPDGTMMPEFALTSLPGHYDCGTIIIHYIIPDGIQGPQHPNPGFPFCGAKRVAYLPNNDEGTNVLKLLQKAWEMKLTFRIGTSLTTGQTNCVTWNDIHHKTTNRGGPYGYPDATYLQRVTADMNALGINLDE